MAQPTVRSRAGATRRPLGTGTTDQRGVTTMTVSLTAPERVRVTASSPLIDGGSKVTEVDVPPRGLTSLTLSASLSKDVRGPTD